MMTHPGPRGTAPAPGSSASHRIKLGVVPHVARLADLGAIFGLGVGLFELYLASERDLVWASYTVALLLATLLAGNLFSLAGLYDQKLLLESRPRFLKALMLWGIVLGALLTLAFGLKMSAEFSRVWFGTWAASVPVALIIIRIGLFIGVRRLAAAGTLSQNIAVVGRGPAVERLLDSVREDGNPLHRIVGIFEETADAVSGSSDGGLETLIALARDGKVDTIVLALPWSAEERILRVLGRLASLPVAIRLAPDGIGFALRHTRFSLLAGVPMLNCFDRPLGGWRWVAKEIEDRLFAFFMLALLAPLLALVALLVKLDSPGPVFFRQNRYGFNNQLIGVYKFRTMHTHLTDANAETLVRPGDSRVTRLGAFLRKSSIDELPQLINVLKGEMSIVGPRPHALQAKAADRLYEEVVGEYHARHRVKPGITGWAQVKGWRGVTDTEEKIRQRVEHDLYYIENWSIGFDVLILAMTVWAVIRPSNAH